MTVRLPFGSIGLGFLLFLGALALLRLPLIPPVLGELPHKRDAAPKMPAPPGAPVPLAIDPRSPERPPVGQEAANDFGLEDAFGEAW